MFLERIANLRQLFSLTLLTIGKAFRQAGFAVAGCVCTTGIGISSTGYSNVNNYAVAQTQVQTAGIFAYAAAHFDEIIIDDFFFTDDESAASNASLKARSVTLFPTPANGSTTTIPKPRDSPESANARMPPEHSQEHSEGDA